MRQLLPAIFCSLMFFSSAPLPAAPRPNIVVILVDDMGFSDIGCYGSEIPTPNLDKLAAGGLRFTQFYNTGRCCPTRASLLTGLYSHQAGVGHMIEDSGVPGYRGRLNDRCVTIAEVLHEPATSPRWPASGTSGRTTASCLGGAASTAASMPRPAASTMPTDCGPNCFSTAGNWPTTIPPCRQGWYTTDLWTDYGIKFIDEARAAKKPFFLYLAHNAPHFPLQAPQDEIAKFRGKLQDRLGQAPPNAPRPADRAGRRGQGLAALAAAARGPGVGRRSGRPSRTGSTTSWRSTRRSWPTWTRPWAGSSTRCASAACWTIR